MAGDNGGESRVGVSGDGIGVQRIVGITAPVKEDWSNEFDFEVTYGSKQTEQSQSCRRSDDASGSIKHTLTNFHTHSHNEFCL